MNVHFKLLNTVTEYDRKQSTKRCYNRYALGQYVQRVQDVDLDIQAGATPRAAVIAAFQGALLTACLKAIGEPKATVDEVDSKPWCYKPVAYVSPDE